MLVNITTTISFNTAKEREAIEKFERDNNITEWKKSVFTTSTMFVNEKTFYSAGGEE